MPGKLTGKLANAILNGLPLDIIYVDRDDVIRYLSEYRIFYRTPDILGTKVQKCHSPASRPLVDKVIDDLKNRRAEVIEQSAKKGSRSVLVRYLAVRSASGEYLGLLEMCQWRHETGRKSRL